MSNVQLHESGGDYLFVVNFDKGPVDNVSFSWSGHERKDLVQPPNLTDARDLSVVTTNILNRFIPNKKWCRDDMSRGEMFGAFMKLQKEAVGPFLYVLEQAASECSSFDGFTEKMAVHGDVSTAPICDPMESGRTEAEVLPDMLVETTSIMFANGIRVAIRLDDKTAVLISPQLPSIKDHIEKTLDIYRMTPLFEDTGSLATQLQELALDCNTELEFAERLEDMLYRPAMRNRM